MLDTIYHILITTHDYDYACDRCYSYSYYYLQLCMLKFFNFDPPPGPAVPGRRREADPATAAATTPSGDRRQRDPDRVLQPDEERRS